MTPAWAGISIVGSTCGGGNNSAETVSCAAATGRRTDDVVICNLYKESTVAVTNLQGFKEYHTRSITAGNTFTVHKFWARLTGNGGLAAYTFSWTGAVWTSVACVTYRGVSNSGTPYDVEVATGHAPPGARTIIPTGLITTTQSSMTIVAGYGDWGGGTWSAGTGCTSTPVERVDFPDASIYDCHASTPSAWSIRVTNSSNETKIGIATALIPQENQRRRVRR